MDAKWLIQRLDEDINVISLLIEEWRHTRDPEIQWAIYVLEYCLDRSKYEMKLLL